MKWKLTISKRQRAQLYWILTAIAVCLTIVFTHPNLRPEPRANVQLAQLDSPTKPSEIAQKVEDLLAQMTLPEKVGQMTQITLQAVSKTEGKLDQKYEVDLKKLREAIVKYHVGSILNVHSSALTLGEWQQLITQIQNLATQETRTGIPILYGIDAIHGANYTLEATLFPQNLAIAATRNLSLARESAAITAYEMRASGIPWNFNPVLDVGRHPLWPRLYETYGEDPYLVSNMGVAYIQGLSGEKQQIIAADKVAGCAKHYLGYSFPLSGKDRTPAWIPERMLRDYFLPPFAEAIAAGVPTVMVNSSEINGIPVHSDRNLLTDVLRGELGFQGFVVSDWEDVKNLYQRDRVASSPKEAVYLAVMAGLDMSMVPYDFSFYNYLIELVQEGRIAESRIDESVRRILHVKFMLNLFANPYPDLAMTSQVGSPEFAQVSLQAARESLTLLKNDQDLLPLNKNQKILVTGPNANLRSVLNGGWTYTWQGNEESLYPTSQNTILSALQEKLDAANITYIPGTKFDEAVNIPEAVTAARNVDVAVVVLGEKTYTETPGNIDDLALPAAQLQLASAIANTGTPVVLVLVEGRPRLITPIVEDAEAILMAYLPGAFGGDAIADVLFGDYNPSGKLPMTYPRSPNDLVTYDHKPIETDTPNKLNPLFSFGFGLSYTYFKYSNLQVNPQQIRPGESTNINVTVKNTGKRTGKEIVELYLSDLYRSVSPPVRQLRRFRGVTLEPGESQTIEFTLEQDDFAFHGRDNQRIVEPGEFKVAISNLANVFTLLAD
ncbi:beta-glucosidase-like glycosyl hydrolase [Xenococcus sp. PCC 7305]|uniref:glycoside hydrolase family 3 N-terminal domain-containing protein n=1 Tax=Xenococcus sp. PCC 7305 TaxID=102125 RepID=UPI0002AD0096|nr:glycoside hydrolase family 3 N-terminal domain-containing protein [Xenococcus sp. PCC 7305]ELS01405.1 beta-glucosidase-like glycosyl hydrolase [Xenococcus sp. PCC 7305]